MATDSDFKKDITEPHTNNINNPEINLLSNEQIMEDQLDTNFLDPGVSNGDVDWLFRGREVKKLTKRSNTINNEVQSQLLQAQQKALVHSKGKDSSILSNTLSNQSNSSTSLINLNEKKPKSLKINTNFNPDLSPSSSSPVIIPSISNSRKSSNATDYPLKSSLKSSSPNNFLNGSPLNDLHLNQQLISEVKSNLTDFPVPNNNNNNNNNSIPISNTQNSTPNTPSTPNRSRSSSLHFGRQKSNSNASETIKPAKKSLLSSLSSKLKTNSNKPSVSTPKSIPTTPINSTNISPITSRSNKPISTTPTTTTTSTIATTTPTTPTTITTIPIIDTLEKKLDSISFKRVCFALDDLLEDPQQQIPSRRPKKGNVLIPEDLLAPPPKLSIGITNSFNEQTKDEKPKVDPKLFDQAVARQNYYLAESKKHSEEAHVAALRIAKEVSSFKKRRSSFLRSDDEDDDDDDEEDITDLRFVGGDETLDIDTPLHEHVDYFGHDNVTNNDNNSNNIANLPTEITLETLYTRCCHLREILPIPATLKQLKNKSKPLHVLKMLNPKPTLIDILSFSDFLAIAPVITVIFDNVSIDTEMLKIILISLKNSKMLDKLSLRNVPIDKEGWSILCKFLKINKNIQKLDISQQKIKKNTDNSKTFLRSDLDWDLFTDTLISRNGIEELVINGCCLDNNKFNKLVNKALTLKTKRFGLASSQLDSIKMSILSKWISISNSTCLGIDFAFNDLSNNQLIPINNILKENGSNISLQFFSLNATNVQLDDCRELIKNLSLLPSLRFLDLGNNPHLFPDILPTLRDYLPKYPDLRRIHFDFDNLNEVIIVQLCLIFQQCPHLVHVSFLGNNKITSKSSSALYSAVKNSHIYNIDMDYDGLDDELVSRIAFYLMRNMENFLNISSNSNSTNFDSNSITESTITPGIIEKDEDLIFDGSLLTKAAGHLLENDSFIGGEERMIIYRSLVEKTIRLRKEIHDSMNKLFKARESGKLSIQGKENLLRFCLLDDSLENILDIFSDEVLDKDDSNNLDNQLTNDNNRNNNDDDSNNVTRVSSRPNMIRKLSSQLNRHQSSEDVMQTGPIISGEFYHNEEPIPSTATEDPHIVVADADSVPVDSTTGKRVLMRKFSQTNVYSKKLEEEEGELHRWGFFVQQQNDIMPDDSQNKSGDFSSSSDLNLAKREEEEREKERLRIEAEKAKQEEEERQRIETEKKKLKINAIPSGADLRETIMKAKGIESISDLIKKVNKDFSTVEKIYKHADTKRFNKDIENNSNESKITSPTISSVKNASGLLSISNSTDAKGTTISSTKGSKSIDDSNKNDLGKSSNYSDKAGEGRNIQFDNKANNDLNELDDVQFGSILSPTISLNSVNNENTEEAADEVYERILNNVVRVRSNK